MAIERFTITQAERKFDIPRRTLYRWMERGYLGWTLSATNVPLVTEGQIQDARRFARQAKSDNISAGVNKALGKG